MEEPVSRFLESRHWGKMLAHHLDGEKDYGVMLDEPCDFGWEAEGCPAHLRVPYTHEKVDQVADGSLSAVWLGDVSPKLGEVIQAWWPKLRPGGYMGGPAFGFGYIDGARISIGIETMVRNALKNHTDSSEVFHGNQSNPPWFVFKRAATQEKVLLLSGADKEHTRIFGDESQANHQAYCDRHNYDYTWIEWDDVFPHKERCLVWAKLWAVQHALGKQWDQVWWIDGDAAFLRFDQRLDRMLHPEWSAIHPEFMDGKIMASTGFWGARAQSLPILEDVWQRDDHGFGYYSEELALSDSMHEHGKTLWKDVQLVDHRHLHSVLDQGIFYHEDRRNFTLHLAKVDNQSRKKIIGRVNEILNQL